MKIISTQYQKNKRSQKISEKMLTINQKYICIYNKHTNQHYIKYVDLQPYILTFTPLLYQYSYTYNHLKTEPTNQSSQPLINTNIINTISNSEKSQILESSIKEEQQQVKEELSGDRGRQLKQSKLDNRIGSIEVNSGVANAQTMAQVQVVNFKQVFELLGICMELCVIKQIYVPEEDRYFQFQQLSDFANCIPLSYTTHQILLLRFTSITNTPYLLLPQPPTYSYFQQHLNNLHYSQQKSNQQQNIKQRDRSRTIGQILQYVRKWRYLAQEGINGKKLNLQEAAQYVGVPKKSLDDYFYQVRVGEKYQFEFQLHRNKNISFLRKFVKDKVPHRQRINHYIKQQQQSPQIIHQKLPKRLKQPQPLPQPVLQIPIKKPEQLQIKSQKGRRMSDSEISSIQPIWPNQLIMQQNIFDDQDSFFNNFKEGNNNFVGFGYLTGKEQNNQDQDNLSNHSNHSNHSFKDNVSLFSHFEDKNSFHQNSNSFQV